VGARSVGIVTPDTVWPNMWRIVYHDGTMSDLLNLARARGGVRRDYLSSEIRRRAA
jgi:hypothetical protein